MNIFKPKVSVVITTYNNSKYIMEAIYSVLEQDYENKEIIIIDDASDDNTEELITVLKEKHPIFYLKKKVNQGPGAARNLGIAASKGEYICFLDADDIYLPSNINKRIEIFNFQKDIGLVFSDFYWQKDPNHFDHCPHLINMDKFLCLLPNKNKYIEHTIFPAGMYQLVIPNGFPHTSTCMIKRNALEKVGLFRSDVRNFEDLDMWLKLIMKFSSAYVNEPLSIYKKYRGSLAWPTSKYFEGKYIFLRDVLKNSSINDEAEKSVENAIINSLSLYSLKLFDEERYKKSHETFLQILKKRFSYSHLLMLIITLLPTNIIDFLKKLKKIRKSVALI